MNACQPARVVVPIDEASASLADALLRLGYVGDPTDGAEQLTVDVLPAGCATVPPAWWWLLVAVATGVAVGVAWGWWRWSGGARHRLVRPLQLRHLAPRAWPWRWWR